jgi:inorganic pyrophosphatase
MNRKYALDVIRDAHETWQRVALGNDDSEAAHYGIETRNVTLKDSFGFTRMDDPVYTEIPPASPKPPAPVDSSSKFCSEDVFPHTDGMS